MGGSGGAPRLCQEAAIVLRSRSQRGGTKERKRRWEGELAPRGCLLARCRRFPAAPTVGRCGLDRLLHASVSLVPPLWSCGFRAFSGMLWKQGSVACSGPSSLGCVWVDSKGPDGGEHRDQAPHVLTLPPSSRRAGDVCAFISNTRLSQAVNGTFPNANTTLDNVHTYVDSIPKVHWSLGSLSGVPDGLQRGPLGKGGSEAGGREGFLPALTPTSVPAANRCYRGPQ